MIKKLNNSDFLDRKGGVDTLDKKHELLINKINEIINAVNAGEKKVESRKRKST